jgi:hypothetical protein
MKKVLLMIGATALAITIMACPASPEPEPPPPDTVQMRAEVVEMISQQSPAQPGWSASVPHFVVVSWNLPAGADPSNITLYRRVNGGIPATITLGSNAGDNATAGPFPSGNNAPNYNDIVRGMWTYGTYGYGQGGETGDRPSYWRSWHVASGSDPVNATLGNRNTDRVSAIIRTNNEFMHQWIGPAEIGFATATLGGVPQGQHDPLTDIVWGTFDHESVTVTFMAAPTATGEGTNPALRNN